MRTRFRALDSRARLPVVCLVAVAAASAVLTQAAGLALEEPKVAAPPSTATRVLEEEWYQLLLFGKPAGYAHQVVSKLDDGTIVTETFQKMAVRRGAVPLETQVEVEVREATDGTVRSARSVLTMSKQKTVTTMEVSGDELEVTTGTPANRRDLKVPFDTNARGPYWLGERATGALKKPGDRFEAVIFLPDQLKCSAIEITLVDDDDSVDLPGAPKNLTRRSSKLELIRGAEIVEWVDSGGRLWKSLQKIPGLTIVQVRSSRDEALRAGNPESPPELLLATSVKPDRPLPRPENLESAVYRLTLKRGDFKSLDLDDAFEAAGQKLVRRESPSSRVVRIGRVAAPQKSERPAKPSSTIAKSLLPSALVQSDDAEILARAREVVGAGTDPYSAAKKLETWVHSHIRRKDLSTAFASAKETLESGRGDCTEHGVLLTALARAARIPARVVTGLVYHEGRFIGHLWTEVHVGEWIPLDATRPQLGVGPTHIAFVSSNLDDASGLGAFLDLVSLLGNLKIEILEP